MMKTILIGATGTIGTQVAKLLKPNHDIIRVGHNSGDFQVDLASKASIEQLYREVGTFDAVICAAGAATFGTLETLSDADFQLALDNKLMGQVNLVRAGQGHINDNGSFTLTSGLLAQQPMPGSASISMVNAGIEGFARAAALELKRGIRVNVVSPIFVKETMQAMGMDSSSGMSAAHTALAYRESLQGKRTGEVLDVREFARKK